MEGKFDELERMRLGGDWGMTMLHDPSTSEERFLIALRYNTNDNDTIPCLIRFHAMPEDEEDPNETNETADTNATNCILAFQSIQSS
jgi:hypothetical protein